MVEKIQTPSPLKVHIRFTPKSACILLQGWDGGICSICVNLNRWKYYWVMRSHIHLEKGEYMYAS